MPIGLKVYVNGNEITVAANPVILTIIVPTRKPEVTSIFPDTIPLGSSDTQVRPTALRKFQQNACQAYYRLQQQGGVGYLS